MATQPQQQSSSSPGAGAGAGVGAYKRASRKGAPRRFPCTWPGCDKIYSRAEHLQRHQLNHEPKEIYKCDVPDCNQMFVRPDLLTRHKRRHSASYVPRNRASSFSLPSKDSSLGNASAITSPTAVDAENPRPPNLAASAPRNASVLLASGSPTQLHQPSLTATLPSPITQGAPWTPSSLDGVNVVRPKPSFYTSRDNAAMHDQSSFAPFPGVQVPSGSDLEPGNFAMWLFESRQNTGDFSMMNGLFQEGGLESPFNNTLHYDQESLASGRSQITLTPPQLSDVADNLLSEFRRQEILRWVRLFRQKQTRSDPVLDNVLREVGGDIPGLNLELMRNCIHQYWNIVSPRMPIVHEPTFSPSRCSIYLLMVIIALGAAQICNQDPTGQMEGYGAFANLIIWNVRSEILNTENASPPVDLWVAQALLLLEFYEKMYSSRKLHERAHIYHPLTLNLLRRGSPLIGGAGSESPPDEQNGEEHPATSDARTSWTRWADTEAMHRVVFAAFMMDIIHAAMFGHAADMAPHEIRLPLPCDDDLWSASSPENLRQRESSFRFYGWKPVSFLDGLKNAIHGREVRTHSFGRMIIMCGLLSVGWHLRHRETHLKWLETSSNSADTREKWCGMLLKAFDDWKSSFDQAMGTIDSESSGHGHISRSNGLVQSAAVLYHLAHISLYIDIVDCQVFARATRLLGRKVSTRDYTNVVARMRAWAGQLSTRHAILHAFRLLYRVLVDPRQTRMTNHQNSGSVYGIQYSCRDDPDPHRPWVVYYATLSIWSFVRALNKASTSVSSSNTSADANAGRSRQFLTSAPPAQQHAPGGIHEYLSNVAKLTELDVGTARTLADGLPELLMAIGALSSESHSEILQEAHGRLEVCREMLDTGAP
ncbi:hypothetical protein SLS62_002929 [Diatrype stigma]|uniref:C2H2-type domain-containing protein n=1 Tax=Diatrype stigma TaxID=117547 RepID=A0AAN9V5U1_9PEZI